MRAKEELVEEVDDGLLFHLIKLLLSVGRSRLKVYFIEYYESEVSALLNFIFKEQRRVNSQKLKFLLVFTVDDIFLIINFI